FPISMRSTLNPLYRGFTNRRQYWIYLFGRLKPGVTVARAQAEMNAIFKPIVNDVEKPLQTGASEAMVKKFAARNIVLEDWSRGHSFTRDSTRTPIYLLFGITGVVLLIACANIANLLLARGVSRSTEMAVRLSLGATRRQLLSQLMTESLVLAAGGAVVGLGVAKATLGIFMFILPQNQAATLHFAIDGKVLVFGAALAVVTGLLFGLFPAMHATRSDLITSIRSGVGKHSGGRGAARLRTSLVTAQIALSMALLIAAGLFVKSLHNLGAVDLGLDLDRLVTFKVSPGLNGYERSRSRQLFMQVERDIAAIPGVTSVSGALVPTLGGENWDNSVSVQGFKKTPDIDDDAHFNEVGPGYFKTMNIPILAGREFTEADAIGTTQVAVVNEAFAEKFKMGKDVVGKFMGQHVGDTLDIQIVGLVKNAAYNSVRNEALPIYVTPYRQDSTIGAVNFYLHTSVDPKSIVPKVPRLIKQLDPNLPVQTLKTLDQQMKDNIVLDRLIGTLASGFAVLATLLAAIGLYGVLAYSVAQRTREIGVRMALGADMMRVRLMVLRQVGTMTLIGAAVGVAGAIVIGRYAASLLFKLSGFDATVTVVSVVALAAVAIGAGYLPARKASQVEPTQALRYE
ncbi:MAG TPA: ADOP family duplicated permease, partial [Gemmatimonadaceae bacterium]